MYAILAMDIYAVEWGREKRQVSFNSGMGNLGPPQAEHWKGHRFPSPILTKSQLQLHYLLLLLSAMAGFGRRGKQAGSKPESKEAH